MSMRNLANPSMANTLRRLQRRVGATNETPKMSTVDTSKLSYSQLIALAKELEQQIESKRDEELKVLADGYVKKIEAAGFTVVEAIGALQPYVAGRGAGKRKPPGSAPVLFRDPANFDNTWSGRGRAAKWLADYETQGRSREEFRV